MNMVEDMWRLMATCHALPADDIKSVSEALVCTDDKQCECGSLQLLLCNGWYEKYYTITKA